MNDDEKAVILNRIDEERRYRREMAREERDEAVPCCPPEDRWRSETWCNCQH